MIPTRQPTIQEIRGCLGSRGLLDPRTAEITFVGGTNHHIYRLQEGTRTRAIRMINQNHREHEQIKMAEEYWLLKAIEGSGLGPKVYALVENDPRLPDMIIQEFVEAFSFNDLKKSGLLSQTHLIGAAQAIAELNSLDITPRALPFLKEYTERALFIKNMLAWWYRLSYANIYLRQKDMLKWTAKILPILFKAESILLRYQHLFTNQAYCFHFDGAHCGNVYWRDGKAIFLDWQKVSYRNDPTFTLMRLLASLETEGKGKIKEEDFNILVDAYCARRQIPHPHFRTMALARLLERLVSDMVWVCYEHARKCKAGKSSRAMPVSRATSVSSRYEGIKLFLAAFPRFSRGIS